MTTQPTGGGGTEFTLAFIGREEFAGLTDQHRYVSNDTETADEERHGFARTLQLGLMRYVAATPLADQLEVVYIEPPETEGPPARDPWNFWVFRSGLNANVNSEQSVTAKSFFGSFSANRTTAEWKIRVGMNGSYNETRFELGDSETFTNETRSLALTGLALKSMGPRWSIGLGGSGVASTFVNQDLTFRVAPAVEYNLFLYVESTRRQFTISYAVGASAFDYEVETIFGETSQTLLDQTLMVFFDVVQPWGQSGLTFEASQFLNDPSQHRMVFVGDVGLRISRGIFLNFSGSASRINDQVFLPAAGLTPQEILVERRELETDHRVSFSVGITFVFGSIYNNVVNSRFAGSSGGLIRTF